MNLKKLRKEKKKSQEEMAQMLNVTQQSYARYELETSEPTISTLCRLADYYGVTLDYLVGREFVNDVGYLNEKEKQILSFYRQMNEENKIRYQAEGLGILVAQN